MGSYNIKSLNPLRGICAVLIFLHHFLPDFGVDYQADFGRFCVLVFFVISGFCMFLNYRDKVDLDTFSYREYIIRRAAKIYPIQWLTVLFVIVTGGVVQEFWLAVPFHLTLTQSFIPLWKINFSLNTPSWFLSSLFFCYLVFPKLAKTVNRCSGKFYFGYFLCLICFILFVQLRPGSIGHRWLCYINPFARCLDFIFGMLLADFYMKTVDKLKGRLIISTIAELSALVLSVISMINENWGSNHIAVLYPVAGILILSFAYGNGGISKLLSVEPVTCFLGSIGLCLYLSHSLIYKPLLPYLPENVLVAFVISFGLVVLISWLLQKYFISWSSKVFINAADFIHNARSSRRWS